MQIDVVFFDLGDTLVVSGHSPRWVPGAEALLTTLRDAGLQLGVISNTGNLSRDQLAPLLPHGFDFAVFDADLVVLSSEIGNVEKPDPRIFDEAVQRAGVAASRCLFCTESLTDTLAAQGAGMKAARLVDAVHGVDLAALPDALEAARLLS